MLNEIVLPQIQQRQARVAAAAAEQTRVFAREFFILATLIDVCVCVCVTVRLLIKNNCRD